MLFFLRSHLCQVHRGEPVKGFSKAGAILKKSLLFMLCISDFQYNSYKQGINFIRLHQIKNLASLSWFQDLIRDTAILGCPCHSWYKKICLASTKNLRQPDTDFFFSILNIFLLFIVFVLFVLRKKFQQILSFNECQE